MKNLLIVTAALMLSAPTFAAEKVQTRQTTQTTDDVDVDTAPTAQNIQERDTTTTTTATTSTTDAPAEERISRGGFFLEPMIFASQEDMSVETSGFGDTSGSARSYGAALRFGGHISEIALLGLDARYSKANIDGTSYGDVDADVYNIAPMVGLQTPLAGIRLTAGYVLAGENNPDGGNTFDVKFKEAQGWRLGAGIHILAVSVNLEYQDLTYNTTEVESVGPLATSSDFDVDANTQGYALTVGFPIEL